jgi:hypothetical protein
MMLTQAEVRFLARQTRGYLATIGPNGAPQVKPLGFTYFEARNLAGPDPSSELA